MFVLRKDSKTLQKNVVSAFLYGKLKMWKG